MIPAPEPTKGTVGESSFGGRACAAARVVEHKPSQALAYKIGAMTIQRLRRKAEAELGDKFDVKDFHAQVLMTGALPLAILEQKIDRWIASKKD